MEGTKIEYKRWNVKGVTARARDVINKTVARALAESGIDSMETKDFELVSELVGSVHELGRSVESYEEQVNYQTGLLEELYREVFNMNKKLEKLEEEINKD